jgi:hypothetical protein
MNMPGIDNIKMFLLVFYLTRTSNSLKKSKKGAKEKDKA